MSARSHDIVIVGGGIVGAAAALALLRNGFDVALVDRAATRPPAPGAEVDARVYAIAPGSRRFLDTLGAWPGDPACAYQGMQVWNADPALSLRFDAAAAALPELGYIVAHDVLLDALWNRLGAARLVQGETVDSFTVEAGGAHLGLSGGGHIRADLVIAADGAGSSLRRLAGIETLGWPYAHQAIVSHVQTERPHRATAYQRFLPEGPLAFLPLADGRSSIVWSTTRAGERMALPDAGFAKALHQASQDCLGLIGEVTPRKVVPLRLLHARDYHAPGLALVGDAAHVVHPLAGQGLNLGLADVEALLGCALEARRAGRKLGSARVLARYGRARKLANLEMLATVDALYRLFGLRAPGLDNVRGLGLALVDRVAAIKGPLLRRAVGI